MTPEQIEAKALEEFPETTGYPLDPCTDRERAAFIKGCQYATPSAVSREDDGKRYKLVFVPEGPFPFENGSYMNQAAGAYADHRYLHNHWIENGEHHDLDLYVLMPADESSPEQPVAGLQWVKASERLPELETKVIVARPNQDKLDILLAYLHDSGETGRSCGRLGDKDWLFGKYWSLPAVVKLETITHWMPLPSSPLNLKP